jgi:hypothetical protein
LTRRIRGQAVYTTFLLTGDAADRADASCRYLGKKPSPWLDWQHDAISGNALDLGPLGTILIASAPYGTPVQSQELTTDAELAVVHLDERGRPRAAVMVRGSQLQVGEKRLIRGGKRREWMQI